MRILSGKVRRKKMRVHLPMSPRAVIAEVVAALEQAELEAGTIAPCPFYPNGRRRRTNARFPGCANMRCRWHIGTVSSLPEGPFF
jgi:hypothetical protein